ncbi:MAG: carboxypeptidase-like regulatory domain-containing protein [Saprospiraceae bacterium]|nr:carboxypeptidase-like regulatory domain-containing protein [Saprospiraceae bacterium]
MKRICFLGSLLLVLLTIACRKETITTDEKVIIQPPTGITATELSGVVRSSTGPLANAQVEVYQGETLVGTVSTDAQGKFSTAGLSLQLGATVTLYAKKADYVSTAKRLKATQPKVKDLKINVLLLSEALFPIKGYLNPADDDLIVVSGYVTDPTGAPAPQPTKPTPTPKSAANNRWKPSP